MNAIGRGLFGFRIEVSGWEHVPAGEPLIVAGGPHRNWVDGFLLMIALPALPRLTFLASENVSDRPWKRVVVFVAGGFESVSFTSAVNREALAAAQEVLRRGDRLGIFPEGWDHLEEPMREIGPFRRGVAFIAQQSGRRVLPVALAGAKPLWRGKTLRVAIGPPMIRHRPMPTGRRSRRGATSCGPPCEALIPPEPPEVPVGAAAVAVADGFVQLRTVSRRSAGIRQWGIPTLLSSGEEVRR